MKQARHAVFSTRRHMAMSCEQHFQSVKYVELE